MIKKILLVKYRFIGDAILAFPAFSAIREKFPDAKIDLLTEPLIASLMAGNPWGINSIVVGSSREARGLQGLLSMAQRLRKEHYDMSMNFIHEYTMKDSLLPFLAGIPERVGFKVNDKFGFFNKSVDIEGDKYISHRGHMTSINAMIPERMGITVENRLPRLWVRPEAMEYAREILKNNGLKTPVAGLHPGAANSIRRWPIEHFAAVARHLCDNLNVGVFCIGSSIESDYCRMLVDMVGRDNCISLAGKLDVNQLVAVIQCASLFISNNSGPMHIAAGLKVPLVALSGATEAMWDPIGDGTIVQLRALTAEPCYDENDPKAQAFNDALRSISPDQVIESIESICKDLFG